MAETMKALRLECARYGVRPARSKAATVARIEEAARVKGILTVRRITQEAMRVLHQKIAEAKLLYPPSGGVAAKPGDVIRIRMPAGYQR